MSKQKNFEQFPFLNNQCEFQRFCLLLLESLSYKHLVQNDLGPIQGDFVQQSITYSITLCYSSTIFNCDFWGPIHTTEIEYSIPSSRIQITSF